VIQIADMHRAGRIGLRLFERQLEQPRIGLFNAPLMRVEQVVEPARELQPIEQVA